MRHLLFLLLSFFPVACFALGPYAAGLIPQEVSRGSDAVVRESTLRFEYKSPESAVMKVVEVITVLNNDGGRYANFRVSTNSGRILKSFSGQVYDANGDVLRKIKKGDLEFSGYSDDLARDYRMYYYDLHVPKGPYTVRYEYEVTIRNGTFNFPPFAPVPGYRVGVVKANYEVIIPRDLKYHVKTANTDAQPEKGTAAGTTSLKWSFSKIPPVASEPFAPSWYEVFPIVVVSPDEFVYQGYKGSMESWEQYGKWQNSLLEGRGDLPQELKNTVGELTRNARSDREKVRILYDYLGQQTRYVSIQLGIGGWQPMKASDVYRNKFGDCKALTNYLMAMLRQCGIESYYTEISMSNKRLWEDFPNSFQTNHVILLVPLEGGDLWLECTNPDLPFGYIHNNIAGNDALVCRDGVMEFTTLPQYADTVNMVSKKLEINISGDRSARMKFTSCFSGSNYETLWGFSRLDSKERHNRAARFVNVPTGTISGISFTEEKTSVPVHTLGFDIEAITFGSTAGQRILLPLNPLAGSISKLGRTRQLDIDIAAGSLRSDTLVYILPEGYIVESLPQQVETETVFGRYRLWTGFTEGQVTVVHEFLLKAGLYPPEQFEELKKLYGAMEESMKGSVVIKPTES